MPLNLSAMYQDPPPEAFAPPPAQQSNRLSPAFYGMPIAGNIADGITTSIAMGKGGREANPIMAPIADHPAAIIAAKTGIGIGEALLLQKLAKKHPTMAKVLAVISGAIPAAAAVHNLTIKAPKP